MALPLNLERLGTNGDSNSYRQLWAEPEMLDALTTRNIAKIYQLLQRFGCSQRRIASCTQQSQSEVSEILAGRRVDSYTLLVRIAEGLSIPRGHMGLAYADLPTKYTNIGGTGLHLPAQLPDQHSSQPRANSPRANARPSQRKVSPMSTVPVWSGREVRALREARRMSVREFAAHLGVSDRMISKWEAGGEGSRPRPLNQSALDTSLALADAETKKRFAILTAEPDNHQRHRPTPERTPADRTGAGYIARHPIDGKLMARLDGGPHLSGRRRYQIWLQSYYIDLHPVTVAEFTRFKAITSTTSAEYSADTWSSTSDGLDPATSTPARDVSLADATDYARWASKKLPTTDQWDRASESGLVIPHGHWEWCTTAAGPAKKGTRGATRGTFRCATPAAELHSLLAI